MSAGQKKKPSAPRPVRGRSARRKSGRPPRTWLARLRNACLLLLAAGLAAPLSLVLVLRWVPPPTTAFIVRDTLVAADTGGPARMPYRWTSWHGIAPHAALAVIASEDQKFPDHNGFDVEAIRMALGEALQGGRLRGASTISQQTAKNLFLWPGRSLFRKGLEAYLTVLIELCWSKRRIIEVYLNVAEFGTGVFGITAASERFFDKRPAELSADEAAWLAAALPLPSRWRVDDPSRRMRERQAWIRGQMTRLGGVGLIEERIAD